MTDKASDGAVPCYLMGFDPPLCEACRKEGKCLIAPAAANARADALAKDAERYRWLRANANINYDEWEALQLIVPATGEIDVLVDAYIARSKP